MHRASRATPAPIKADSRLAEAVHEAGHFIVTYACGLPPLYVTIAGVGEHEYPHCMLADACTPSQAKAKLVAMYAGYESELRVCAPTSRREAVSAANKDFRLATEMIREFHRPKTRAELVRFRRHYRKIARHIIAETWDAIWLIAYELLRYGTVTRDHAISLIATIKDPASSCDRQRLIAHRIMRLANTAHTRQSTTAKE